MRISIQDKIGKGYNDAFYPNCKARYRVFEGGRATKKSVDIGGYEIIFKILMDSNRNIVVARKDDTNNSSSTYPNIVNLINEMNMGAYFKCKVSPYEIIYKPTKQKIIFKGCNNPEAISSTKFIVGEFTDVYFEEASELTSFEDFRKIDGAVRPKNSNAQITLLCNGWDKKSWIYEQFFKGRLEDDYNYLETHDYQDFYDPKYTLGNGFGLYLHKSTFRINEFRPPFKDASMIELKRVAPEIYKVEGLGMWGNTHNQTYLYWNDSLIKGHSELMQLKYSCYTIGIDIGMGNGEGKIIRNTKDQPNRYRSAMTMCLGAITQDFSKMVSLDEYFFSNEGRATPKGSPEVAEDMINKIAMWISRYKTHPVLMKGTILCYVDSADSGGFRTLLEAKAKEKGIANIKFIPSTKNKIQTRVDFWNLMMAYGDFYVCNLCENLIREIRNARAGEDGSPREDVDDHTINSQEYFAIPLLNTLKRWKDFKAH